MYYYKQIKNGKTVSVESKSVKIASPEFIEAVETEYNDFIASIPPLPLETQRDLAAEIDALQIKIAKLEKKYAVPI